ncbi:MAG TPA: hypothetical protein VNJ01_08765 [Bacteriovoracaceae bacterium]|nr:hypothetical protein [Bacteriovoracaceae bacterium]
MTILKIAKGVLKSTVEVPASKSYANRALIVAAIKNSTFTIHNLPESTDVTLLLQAFPKIGLKLERKVSSCTIHNSFPDCEGSGATLEVGEGGTTARFLAALLLRGQKPYTLILGEKLKTRPWSEFLELVAGLGARAVLKDNELHLQGPLLLQGELEVDCGRTTQFASGLQLAYADQKIKIIPTHMTSSQSYWRMTEKLIGEILQGTSYSVPLDWSSASYPLAFGALNQEIFFPGLQYDQYQADSKFYQLLKSLGAIEDGADGIRVKPLKSTRDVELDVVDCLDLVPALGFLLSHLSGQHILRGIANLEHKESNRLQECLKLFKKFSKTAYLENDRLVILGPGKTQMGKMNLELPNDHRMVMTGTLFLLQHNGGSVEPSEAVSKSYPEFFSILK